MCDHASAVANPSVHQTLDELEFQKSLCSAALYGELEKVEQHLRKGTKINSHDAGGYAPLHYAARSGHIEVAKLLLSHGGDVDIQTKAGKATPLLRAAFAGKAEMCKFLIQKGANLKLVDDDGQNVIHRALKSKNMDLVRYFVEIAPELKMQADKRGETPLDVADCEL